MKIQRNPLQKAGWEKNSSVPLYPFPPLAPHHLTQRGPPSHHEPLCLDGDKPAILRGSEGVGKKIHDDRLDPPSIVFL
jgi:hypothetical protein